MKTICITGGNGLLGRKLLHEARKKYNCLSVDLFEKKENQIPGVVYYNADISDKGQVEEFFKKHKCDIIINTAAYTDVDGCEENPETAAAVNQAGALYLAKAAKNTGAKLIHISTDYVFDGLSGPYSEEDKTRPLSVYGKTKLEGEKNVFEILDNAIIARTMILFGFSKGVRHNFVTWLQNAVTKGRAVKIVNDQYGTPTFADELAKVLLLLVEKNASGLFHISGPEMVSRWEFALQIADVFELDKSKIIETNSGQFKQKAPRPMKSGFVLDKVKKITGYQFLSLESCLREMRHEMEGKR